MVAWRKKKHDVKYISAEGTRGKDAERAGEKRAECLSKGGMVETQRGKD